MCRVIKDNTRWCLCAIREGVWGSGGVTPIILRFGVINEDIKCLYVGP